MAYLPPARRSRLCAWALFALGILALAPRSSMAQDVPQRNLVTPGNTKNIQLLADDVATWMEGGYRVFLMRGRVLIEQGVANLRAAQAVVWVDEAGIAQGNYLLEVYGEGDVELAQGPQKEGAPRLLASLATRGQISIKAYASKIAQRELASDPVYQRAKNVRSNQAPLLPAAAAVPGPGITPVGGGTPAASLPPASLPPAAFPPNPANTGPGTNAVAVSSPGQNIQLTQGNPVPGSSPSVVPLPKDDGLAPPPPSAPPPPQVPSGMTPLPLPPPNQPPRQLTIRPRSGLEIQARNYPLPSGETAVVITSGVILSVANPGDRKGLLDIEADRLVFWSKGNTQEIIGNLKAPQGQTSNNLEFYLSGNVELRNQAAKETQILRADEVYYDVGRGFAIALKADLEIRRPDLKYPIHMKSEEIWQMNPKLFQSKHAQVFASALPSDPGLTVDVYDVTIEDVTREKKTIFGFTFTDSQTGGPRIEEEKIFTGRNMVVRLENFPVFYFPYLRGNVEDPLGPLDGLNFNYNSIFGFQLMTTWNMYDLLGVDKLPGTRWQVMLDYLSERGPALGSEFDFAGKDMLGFKNNYQGLAKFYTIYDSGLDVLGGNRGQQVYLTPTTILPVSHPNWRGRFQGKLNVQDMPEGFSAQANLNYISDKNFLEQYFQNEWLNDLNQETNLYVKQQKDNWAWTILGQPGLRPWLTQTEWLPKADGYLLGQSLFDRLTYNVHGSAGYGRLRPTTEAPFAYQPTDVPVNTGRFDVWQDLSLPLTVGPFKIVPYLTGDLTYYTEDATGDDRGRLYGGAGVRGSIPFSRLYSGVESDVFNLNGLFHKVTVNGNYYYSRSSTSLFNLPQLDRLNDDASDQALRDIRPLQTTLNPQYGAFLTTSPLFDPQLYAVRRLVDGYVDTLDSMNVYQFRLNQRLQTKRGFPGNQHVVDWMTFDVGASVFPQSSRDNFGQLFGILEYDWVWNIGDRTALVSNGWFEPVENGPRVFNVGANYTRPDNTSFYLGYRQIDPLLSQALIGSATFPFSAKYALTASAVWDFGIDSQTTALILTRTGTDVQVSLGVTYNSILNNLGLVFEIMPNLLPANRRGAPGAGGLNTAAGGLGR